MQVADILAKFKGVFRSNTGSIQDYRNFLDNISRFSPTFNFNVKRKMVKVKTFSAELHQPKNGSHHMMLYLHGGGYAGGSHKTHRSLVSEICANGNFSALVPNYRLAPEDPFPAALEDALSSYQYLLRRGYRPEEIIVAGDSAGGGLTMALLYHLKDNQMPLPKAAVLICPWTDLKCTGQSLETNKDDIFVSKKGLRAMVKCYVSKEYSTDNPYISPLYGDPSNLPPILIHVGGKDPICDDGIRMHKKITEVGGASSLEIYPEMFHVWHAFHLFLPDGKKAVKAVAKFAREEFER